MTMAYVKGGGRFHDHLKVLGKDIWQISNFISEEMGSH